MELKGRNIWKFLIQLHRKGTILRNLDKKNDCSSKTLSIDKLIKKILEVLKVNEF